MLEITALDPAPEEASAVPATTDWGVQQRLMFLGTAIALAAIVCATLLYVQRPVSRFSFNPEEIVRSAKSMPPAATWENWEIVKSEGLDRRTDREYADALVRFYVWEGVFAVVAMIGIALIATGATWARTRRSAVTGQGTSVTG